MVQLSAFPFPTPFQSEGERRVSCASTDTHHIGKSDWLKDTMLSSYVILDWMGSHSEDALSSLKNSRGAAAAAIVSKNVGKHVWGEMLKRVGISLSQETMEECAMQGKDKPLES